jgi:RecA-family ATPase
LWNFRHGPGIAIEKVRWLWPPFFQRGAINLITGDPGIGKSTLICDIAATLTTGRPWPGESEWRPPCNVLLLNAEDRAEDTIVPRLIKQGADLNHV